MTMITNSSSVPGDPLEIPKLVPCTAEIFYTSLIVGLCSTLSGRTPIT